MKKDTSEISLSQYLHSSFSFKESYGSAVLNFLLKVLKTTLFAGLFFMLLHLSNQFTLGLYRYDFLFFGAIAIQVFLLLVKYESFEDLLIITIFHILGMLLEIFKTSSSIGSWSYPEIGYLKIFNVPLYAGFMYSVVGSTIMKGWCEFKFSIKKIPSIYATIFLTILVYLNFFTHHFTYDIRYILIIAIIALYWKTRLSFCLSCKTRSLNISITFLILGFCIWISENLATFLGAWKYPNQILSWHIVSYQKILSWSLLVIISFIIIAIYKKAWKR